MSQWPLRTLRPHLSLAALVAALAHGGAPEPNPPKQDDPIETFCNKRLRSDDRQACNVLKDLKPNLPALADKDFVSLNFYIARRHLEAVGSTTTSAEKAVLNAVSLLPVNARSHGDPAGTAPSVAVLENQPRIDKLLKAIPEVHASDLKLAPKVLLDIADWLCQKKRFEDAGIVLDLVSTDADWAPVALRRGVLLLIRLKSFDEAGARAADQEARAAFQYALKLKADVALPDYAPEEAHRLLAEFKTPAKAPAAPDAPVARPGNPTDPVPKDKPTVEKPPPAGGLPWNGQKVGVAAGCVGGASLVVGTVMGIVAFTTKLKAEQAAGGNQADYDRYRLDASVQSTLADAFSSFGGVALATGAILYLFTPPGGPPGQAGAHPGTTTSVGVGVQKGQMSLLIDGHF